MPTLMNTTGTFAIDGSHTAAVFAALPCGMFIFLITIVVIRVRMAKRTPSLPVPEIQMVPQENQVFQPPVSDIPPPTHVKRVASLQFVRANSNANSNAIKRNCEGIEASRVNSEISIRLADNHMSSSRLFDVVPDDTNNTCVVCIERKVQTVLLECGHSCLCTACSSTLWVRGRRCPICREYFCGIMELMGPENDLEVVTVLHYASRPAGSAGDLSCSATSPAASEIATTASPQPGGGGPELQIDPIRSYGPVTPVPFSALMVQLVHQGNGPSDPTPGPGPSVGAEQAALEIPATELPPGSERGPLHVSSAVASR